MANASLDPIKTRLNGVDPYHPVEAETFSDWSVEAGDMVTLKRGDNEYSSPVHTSRMVWKGTPQVSLNSGGSKERDAIAKVSRKKYGRGSGAMRNEIGLYKEFTSSDGYLHSYLMMTESRLVTHFDNAISDLHSEIGQTAGEIYSAVWTANSNVYSHISQTAYDITSTVGNELVGVRTQIVQTASDIRSTVDSELDDIHTEIYQTQSMIRSSVWTANSTVFTYIDQTASYILDHVGARSGSKVIASTDEPQDTSENPLSPGDIWVEGTLLNTWDDFNENDPWVNYDPTAPQYDWLDVSGQKVHVWKDGKWNEVIDGTTLAEDAFLQRTSDRVSMIASNLQRVDGEFRKNLARLDVKADSISQTVTQNSKNMDELGSRITQTATQIRSEVHAASSTLYSAIEQTATQIRSEVADTAAGLSSSITQTASAIRMEVNNSVSNLQSQITQEANKISLVVKSTASGDKVDAASIVAGINDQSGSYVKIKAKTINLSGYVTASQLESVEASINNLKSGNAAFKLLAANRASIGTSGTGTVSIYGHTLVAYTVTDDGGTVRKLFGYT